jgi:hypothetical protein
MLGNKKAVANVVVKDLDVATKFYKNTLGLIPERGGSMTGIHPPFAGQSR